MSNNLFVRIRELSELGLGVDDIIVEMKLAPTKITRELVRATAFGPREVISGDKVVRIR